MKYNTRNFIAVILALLFMFGSTMPVFAAGVPTEEFCVEIGLNQESESRASGNVYPYPPGHRVLSTNTSWQMIAYSTKGFNCNVTISCMNTTVSACDICMLGKNGNIVWTENGAIGGASSRTFWCGSDVYEIQIRTQSGSGTAYAYQS